MHLKKASVVTAAVVCGGMAVSGTADAKPGSPTPCAPTAKACVSQSTNQTWLQGEDGKASYGPVPNTVGKAGQETPNGTFHVQWKDADHRSGEFDDAPMPNAVFFTESGVAFHEGSLEDESNGCIHLSTTAAKKFFDNLNQGDEVQVVP